MKKAGIAAVVAAGIVVLGGGGYALGTMNGNDTEPEPQAVESPSTPTPEPTVTVTVTPEPEPVETHTETTPAEVPAEPEDPFITAATKVMTDWGKSLSEDEMRTAGNQACEELASGTRALDIQPLPQFGPAVNGQFVYAAEDHLC